jgi:hypothetical protein
MFAQKVTEPLASQANRQLLAEKWWNSQKNGDHNIDLTHLQGCQIFLGKLYQNRENNTTKLCSGHYVNVIGKQQ